MLVWTHLQLAPTSQEGQEGESKVAGGDDNLDMERCPVASAISLAWQPGVAWEGSGGAVDLCVRTAISCHLIFSDLVG